MSTFVIAYDLNREVTRPPIVTKIKELCPSWALLSESSYAVSTSKTAQGIFDALKPLIDSNDNLYVIPLKKPYAGFGPKEVIAWLDSNLSY